MVVQQKCFARSPRPGVAPYKVQKALKNKKKPTGDPDCTVEVRRAKHIVHAIQGKIGVEDYESEEEVEDEGLYDLPRACGGILLKHNLFELAHVRRHSIFTHRHII